MWWFPFALQGKHSILFRQFFLMCQGFKHLKQMFPFFKISLIYVCNSSALVAIMIFALTKHIFFNLAWVCNELVVKFLLFSLLSKLFCFKYSKCSLAVISWLIADKNYSMVQFSFLNFRLISNFILLGNFFNIIGTNKGPKCS